jgi:folate-dependent phosphoribosylglycinamide formyltransferase PurN
MTLRIGWFSTGAGPGSQRYRLLSSAVEAIRSGSLDAEIAFVFCNRERGEDEGTDTYLDLVESFGLTLITSSSRDFRRARGGELSKPGQPLPSWRREYDRAVAGLLESRTFDVGMLAGYMLIFTGELCNKYPLLNLHPAAPGGPAGTWQEVIRRLIDERASESGVMIHRSTEELDAGPVVSFCRYSLRGPDIDVLWEDLETRQAGATPGVPGGDDALFLAIRRRGAAREEPLVLATLHALASGRIGVDAGGVVDRDGHPLDSGLDLTSETNVS